MRILTQYFVAQGSKKKTVIPSVRMPVLIQFHDSLFCIHIAPMHEVTPSVVAMAVRIEMTI